MCGWNNNYFKDCMGSPIRSEIWACLAPGCPEVAARYAFLDAIVDHGGGAVSYTHLDVYKSQLQGLMKDF